MARRHYNRGVQNWLGLWQQSARLPLIWWELYWASAQTIGSRMASMAIAGPNPDRRQQRENQRMVAEKTLAGMETMQRLLLPNPALPLAYWRLWSGLWRPLTGTTGSWMPLLDLSLAASKQTVTAWNGAARPWHRRATANARRLR